jgi:hypothetical protein
MYVYPERRRDRRSRQITRLMPAGGQGARGGGFVSVNCCDLTLTEADKTAEVDKAVERYAGETAKPGVVIDESKNYPNACGLRVEIVGGGGGLKSISCCGNELTVEADAV